MTPSRPVPGNTGGSYLTLKSNSRLIFGVIELCHGFGTVFLDQGYWQRAIASRPTTAVRAYILGSLAWCVFLHFLSIASQLLHQTLFHRAREMQADSGKLVCNPIRICDNSWTFSSRSDQQFKVPNLSRRHDRRSSTDRSSCTICGSRFTRKRLLDCTSHHALHGRDLLRIIRTHRSILDPDI
ncbi:hypothetical protein BJ878DRAFT_64315 [Calycina marina]|uniref:Uncharacterized protein n=1 Tax=Calycina marina TaxID=1763456 RepID=A0A9P8CEX0_9HELO|nr:hypothetical protein BJ878DRAFT_64315 [Calycina marina]